MNHLYRLVWDRRHQMLIAVAENAGSHSQGGTPRRRRPLGARLGLKPLVSALLLALGSAPALALELPSGGQVTRGSASITTSGNAMTITQASDKAILEWQQFNISADGAVRFVQPSSASVALNRVQGSDASAIYGRLDANGQVFLVNPNGVYFAPGAQVNVGGLVASTLVIGDEDFTNGHYHFSGESGAEVVNAGAIQTTLGGYVALIGNRVVNSGTLTTPQGTSALGAGSSVQLTLADNALVSFQVDGDALDAQVANGGLIQADGGRVVLSARARDALLDSVVNNSGVIRAQSVAEHDGVIELFGGASGTVQVGGTLDASAPNGGDGGLIETSGAHVTVADTAVINASAATGEAGSWLIDPDGFTIAASGGDMSGLALSNALALANVRIESVNGSGSDGAIKVDDTVTWAANTLTLSASGDIHINTAMNGSGTAGLALEYGQGAVAAGNTAEYHVNAPVNLASSGSFSTKLGSDGTPLDFVILTSLGTEGNTTSGTDLQGIISGQAYVLGADIDASATATWNSDGEPTPTYAGFTPPGVSGVGVFDGLGHTISNLYVNRPTETQGTGLFKFIEATVQNLNLTNVDITGSSSVGGLVGQAHEYSPIKHVTVSGSVTAVGYAVDGSSWVGGLTGWLSGSISDGHFSGTVTGAGNAVGGLAGVLQYGFASGHSPLRIENSSTSGTVSGVNQVGGLAGYVTLKENYATEIDNSSSSSTVTGATNVGGLVGYASISPPWSPTQSVSITDSHASGAVSGNNAVGGLVGWNGGYITGSDATGAVTRIGSIANYSVASVGGLVGENASTGAIATSYATGNVASNIGALGHDSQINLGGLVGLNAGAVSDSHATGNSTSAITDGSQPDINNSSVSVGGLVGRNSGTLSNGYASGAYVSNITSGSIPQNRKFDNNLGGLVGVDTGTVSNSHYNIDLLGGIPTRYGVYDGQYQAWFDNGSLTPLSIGNYASTLAPQGSGVYGISTVQGLKEMLAFADDSAYSFKLLADISLPADYAVPLLATAFDGNQHTLSNLSLNTNQGEVGLFRALSSGASVSDLTLTNASVAGGPRIGLLAGASDGANISNVHVYGDVFATSIHMYTADLFGTNAGGLVGLFANGQISDSSATGNVTASSSSTTGGLVGNLNSAGITRSYANGGSVSSPYPGGYIGGLVGVVSGTSTISDSFSAQDVSGSFNVGGLVGYQHSGSLTATNVYATGRVTTSGEFPAFLGLSAGGLFGRVGGGYGDSSLTLSNAYYAGPLTHSSSAGVIGTMAPGTYTISNTFYDTTLNPGMTSGIGIARLGSTTLTLNSVVISNSGNAYYLPDEAGTAWGLSTADLQTQANLTSATTANGAVDPAWDFSNTWVMYEGHTAPLLRSLLTPLTITAVDKVYDGQSGSGLEYSVTPDAAHLLGTLSDSSLGGKDVGSYTATLDGLWSDQLGYLISYVSGGYAITPAALTLTGSRAYDGTTVMAGGNLTATGVNGESFSISGTGDASNLASQNVQSDSALASLTGLTLGTSGNGGLASNYQPLSTVGSLITIDPAVLRVVTRSTSKVYDGVAYSGGAGYDLIGLVGGEDSSVLSGTLSYTGSAQGAVYTGSYTLLAQGLSAQNYVMQYEAGSLTISAPVATSTGPVSRRGSGSR